MSRTDSDFYTSLPGEEVPAQEAKTVRMAFIKKFRTTDPAKVPSNIPTACVLNGRKDRNYLNSAQFLNRTTVFFYIDSYQGLRCATPQDVIRYLYSREQWEDYDICIFDKTLEWCVGITHDDNIIVVD